MKTRVLVIIFLGFIFLLNLHLLGLCFPSDYMFCPVDFMQGQWYRIFTYAWIHVSWYHLLVDLSAFLMLFYCLNTISAGKKIFYVLSCMIGTALFSLSSPLVYEIGLCGLSGTAHGLTAVCMLTEIYSKQSRRLTLFMFVLFIAKCVYESFTGSVFFANWHPGNIGNPVTVCHAGGAITGIIGFIIIQAAGRVKEGGVYPEFVTVQEV